MGIPYVIVKGKARLGTVVHKKIAAVLSLQDIKSEDKRELATLISAAKVNLCGDIRGYKSTQMFRKRAKAAGLNPNASNLDKL